MNTKLLEASVALRRSDNIYFLKVGYSTFQCRPLLYLRGLNQIQDIAKNKTNEYSTLYTIVKGNSMDLNNNRLYI